MADITATTFGQANSTGTEDVLFLKQFSGEVITAFEQATKTAGADMVR